MPIRQTAQEFLLKQEQETKVTASAMWQTHPFSWFVLLIFLAMWFFRKRGQ
jgi:hypothetical protein